LTCPSRRLPAAIWTEPKSELESIRAPNPVNILRTKSPECPCVILFLMPTIVTIMVEFFGMPVAAERVPEMVEPCTENPKVSSTPPTEIVMALTSVGIISASTVTSNLALGGTGLRALRNLSLRLVMSPVFVASRFATGSEKFPALKSYPATVRF
jgi:hypothetical protein